MDFEMNMREECRGAIDYFTYDILAVFNLYTTDIDKKMCKNILIDEFTTLVENICEEITEN